MPSLAGAVYRYHQGVTVVASNLGSNPDERTLRTNGMATKPISRGTVIVDVAVCS
jgi:hypothetical protein